MPAANALHVSVIAGSTRPNRFSDKPARWIFEQVQKREDVTAELLDLRDYPLPFFEEPMSPSMLNGTYSSDVANRWAAKVKASDAFVIVTPEYNHGYSAVLKNALDYPYPEWNRKAVGFVSYGSVGGARAVEQLRQVAVELQMASVRQSVHIPGQKFFPILMGKAPWEPEKDDSLMSDAATMLEQLLWWGRALKAARSQS